MLSTTEAEDWGLVNRVVPPGELLGQARAMAEQMLTTVPEILVKYKKLLDRSFNRPGEEALTAERKAAMKANAKVDRAAIPGRVPSLFRASARARRSRAVRRIQAELWVGPPGFLFDELVGGAVAAAF